MPTRDRCAALARDDLHAIVEACCFAPRPDAAEVGKVGLEAEVFPIWRAPDGFPAGRMPLTGEARPGSTDIVEGLPLRRQDVGGVPSFALPDEGRVTFEPGGQVEVATGPRDTAAAALDDLDAGVGLLAGAFGDAGARLASAGLDVWHRPDTVVQQLTAARYPLMAAYLARRGAHGHVMMCHSASLQVNLCLGPPGVAEERWLVANLTSPLVTATFATSPAPGVVSARGRLWRRLDRTRTGVPHRLVHAGASEPVGELVDAALRADVMLTRSGKRWRAGQPGWTFATWLDRGDRHAGWPTTDDLVYHLTTLFHEVRARGFLEVRGVDSLPARWRAVPVVLLAGALYDGRARGQIRAVLERHLPELPSMLGRATVRGVADPAMCALAVEVWSLALAGAGRLPAGYVRAGDLQVTESFLDRFTLRGRSPSDGLAEQLATSPAAALAWASDPVGVPAAPAGGRVGGR